MPLDALVLDARLRQSLVTVRSLGRRRLAVAALETVPAVPAFFSRWCTETLWCPFALASHGYLDYLDRWLTDVGAHTLIPSHDGTIALIRRHRASLERRTAIALANEPAMNVATNKARTLGVASRLGIAVPRGVIVGSLADLERAIGEVGLPAVVKPVESWVWTDQGGVRLSARLVTTKEEARDATASLAQGGQTVLFQELLTGRREAVSLLFARGELYARFAQWAKRTGPPLGGESVLRQSIPIPDDIGSQAERLVREIGLEGYSEVEFRRDADGVPFLMEINPRLSASVEIAVRAGVDFPHLIMQWATGRRIDRVAGYRTGGWMRYLRGDFMATIARVRERGRPGIPSPIRAIADFGWSFFQPAAYDYLDWSDPMPAARAAGDFARDMFKSVVAHGGLPLLRGGKAS